MTRPLSDMEDTPYARQAPGAAPGYRGAVLRFDPATDTSPYAAKRPAKKRAARPAASQAARLESRAALRIVPSDDPGAIRRYAEEQRRSELGRAQAGTPLPGELRPMRPAGPQKQPASQRAAAQAPSRPSDAPRRPERAEQARQEQAGRQARMAWEESPLAGRPASGRPAASSRQAFVDQIPDKPSVAESRQTRSARAASSAAAREAGPSGSARGAARAAAAATAQGSGAARSALSAQVAAAAAPAKRGARRVAVDAERAWQLALMWVTALACVAATVAMLYLPSQQLYLSMRENERLTDELAQNEARADRMQQRVTSLQTAEGIQDEAHTAYGYVMPGEEYIVVTGLDLDSQAGTTAEVPRGSGQTTDTWATRLLDRVFQVTGTSASTATASDVATVSEAAGQEGGA